MKISLRTLLHNKIISYLSIADPFRHGRCVFNIIMSDRVKSVPVEPFAQRRLNSKTNKLNVKRLLFRLHLS